jgi:hypothetical protein
MSWHIVDVLVGYQVVAVHNFFLPLCHKMRILHLEQSTRVRKRRAPDKQSVRPLLTHPARISDAPAVPMFNFLVAKDSGHNKPIILGNVELRIASVERGPFFISLVMTRFIVALSSKVNFLPWLFEG